MVGTCHEDNEEPVARGTRHPPDGDTTRWALCAERTRTTAPFLELKGIIVDQIYKEAVKTIGDDR